MAQPLTQYEQVHAALRRIAETDGADARDAIAAPALKRAQERLTDRERTNLQLPLKRLQRIKGVGENTAWEILAALGMLMDDAEERDAGKR